MPKVLTTEQAAQLFRVIKAEDLKEWEVQCSLIEILVKFFLVISNIGLGQTPIYQKGQIYPE